MEKYIYVLPYKIQELAREHQVRIITQKSSIILSKSTSSDLICQVLSMAGGKSVMEICDAFSTKLSREGVGKILEFLDENHIIYVSNGELPREQQKLMEYFAQYTTCLEKNRSKLTTLTFGLYGQEEFREHMTKRLREFGLQVLSMENLERDLPLVDVVLSAYDATETQALDSDAACIGAHPGVLWMFAYYYGDAFLLSPLLNKENYTDFQSFREQVNMEEMAENGISKNVLVQGMAENEMLMDVINSILKLNLQTSYNKTIIYDSIEKKLMLERVYYFPSTKDAEELAVSRWDGEL
ncbi:MAG: hypothetical protein K6G04_01910 [Lachnospiraceae bacterium]|nr:hypothetical protein [Lachnospiraceae bacterium]